MRKRIKIGKIYSCLDKFSKASQLQIYMSFVGIKSRWKYIKIHFLKYIQSSYHCMIS